MDRRGFLVALAGMALDPERLLWTRRKTIFVPSLTSLEEEWEGPPATDWISPGLAAILVQDMRNMGKHIALMEYWMTAEYGSDFPVGHTVRIRHPRDYARIQGCQQ